MDKLNPHFRRNCRGELALKKQHVLQLPLVSMRPRMSLVADADQLSGYSYAASVAPHRTFDDVINPQFPADLADPLASALVLHRRSACDDAEPLWRQAAELGDDIVGETGLCRILYVPVCENSSDPHLRIIGL